MTKVKTKCIINIAIKYGEVAQLARASGSYPAGREFESPLRYQNIKINIKSTSFILIKGLVLFIFIINFLIYNKNPRLSRKMS